MFRRRAVSSIIRINRRVIANPRACRRPAAAAANRAFGYSRSKTGGQDPAFRPGREAFFSGEGAAQFF